MNSFSIIVLILVVAGPATIYSFGEIDGGLISTARIARAMCFGKPINDTVAQDFFNCYNLAPGIELFEKCQMQVNGYLLNTAENLKKSCRSLYLFPKYALCLKKEFEAAGINLRPTLDIVNKCEGEVLGIE